MQHHSSARPLLKRESDPALSEHAEKKRLFRVPQDPGGSPIGVEPKKGHLDLTLTNALNLGNHLLGREIRAET